MLSRRHGYSSQDALPREVTAAAMTPPAAPEIGRDPTASSKGPGEYLHPQPWEEDQDPPRLTLETLAAVEQQT